MRSGVCAALLGLAACGGSAASSSHPDRSSAIDATVVQTTGDSSIASDDGSSASSNEGAPHDNLPDPPPRACDGGANDCPLPPSTCVDAGVAVTYQGGACSSGMCSWLKEQADCESVGASCAPGSQEGAIIDGGMGADGGVWATTKGCAFFVPSPALPATPCSMSADASDICPLPKSVCADSRWLVYYDNSQCVAGSCVWEMRYVACPIGCEENACVSPGTVPPNL